MYRCFGRLFPLPTPTFQTRNVGHPHHYLGHRRLAGPPALADPLPFKVLRFKELLGETPLEYLTNWRMYKATGSLQEDGGKLFEVAKSVGYDSDAAFSKAFKRVLGMAPKEYRRSAAEARRG